MNKLDFYGIPDPVFPSVSVLYVGDEFGFAQLARFVRVITLSAVEAESIFDAVDVNALVLTPLAGRWARGDWPSLGSMKEIADYPPYETLVSGAKKAGIPVIAWLHNEPKTFVENILLAENSDVVWTPDSRSAERHAELGRRVTVVRNLPSEPLRALQGANADRGRRLGVATQGFTLKAKGTTAGKNYRHLFQQVGFDYLESNDFLHGGVSQFREDTRRELLGVPYSRGLPAYTFVGFRANSGVPQTFEFIDLVFDGSYPVGLIDPEGGRLHKNSLKQVFESEPLHLYSINEVQQEGQNLADKTRYWTYWGDAVRNGLLAHDMKDALQFVGLLDAQIREINRTVVVPASGIDEFWINEISSCLDENTSVACVNGKRAKVFQHLDGSIHEFTAEVTPETEFVAGSKPVYISESSPTKNLLQMAVALSRYSALSFDGNIPVVGANKILDWAHLKF